MRGPGAEFWAWGGQKDGRFFICWDGVLDARRGFLMPSWGFLAVDWDWQKSPGGISEILMV